ncbi:ribosome production factor 1-like [Clavelina lepadiformis]|uniref:Ribosome production factor 1 n=1 Tax=Clavelina lepadiformis TaxID=159417 RepID=A0ABP0GAX1_CLALP
MEVDDDQVSICSGGVFSDIASVSSLDLTTSSSTDGNQLSWNISQIRNKQKRAAAYVKLRREQRKERIKLRNLRQKQREQLGEDAPPVQPQKTIDNQREKEDTMVHPEDKEVLLDEETDEMANYFERKQLPKILLTTSDRPRSRTTRFLKEYSQSLPNSFVYYRRALDIKKIITQCLAKGYTDIIIINEDRKTPNGLVHCHLPDGPTTHFKMSNVKLRKEIKHSTTPTSHQPEIILNNFGTRLGHTVGRMFASLYPHDPQFKGRQVATYHNQRDFVFFRHHRYIFRNEKRVGLQEIGPRFTLKLRSLQKGTFDSKYGEYEWIHKRHEMDSSRRKFHL